MRFFWRDQICPPKLVQKWLERVRKEEGLGVFMVVKRWDSCFLAGACMIWNSHWCQRKECLHYLISLPMCGGREEEGVWDLKLSAVKFQKAESDLLLKFSQEAVDINPHDYHTNRHDFCNKVHPFTLLLFFLHSS